MKVNVEDLRNILRKVEDAEQKNFEFAVGSHVSEDNILPMFTIEGLGTIPVPVSIKDLNRIKKMSESAYCCHKKIGVIDYKPPGKVKKVSWQLDAAHIVRHGNSAETFFRQTIFSLAKDGLRQLGVADTELPLIEIRSNGMLICERGGYAPIHCDNEKEPGLFGLMTIQIPVKNGYEGGVLKVNHQGQSRMFDNSNNSKKSFYTTIFYAGCEHELTEVTSGWRLVFKFSLIWKWTRSLFVPIPADDNLLGAAKEIDRILSPWRLPCSQRCLAIPLEHNYTAANLSFSGLKGRDRLTASLLRSVNFVDLHLASVHRKLKPSTNAISSIEYSLLEPQMKEEYCIGCWVASRTDSPFPFQGLEIDFDSEVVYPMFSRSQTNLDYTESHSQNLTDYELESSMEFIYCQALLVVWPKTSTIDLACRHGFVGALDLLEYLARTMPPQEVLFVLGRTVTFCCANPRLVWCNSSYTNRKSPPSPGQVTYRLLQLCIDLDAPEQGLILLNLIADDLPAIPTETSPWDNQSDAAAPKEIEGLQNNQVAVALSKLIARAGWDSCKEAVSHFLTPPRIAQQMEPLTVLVTSLMDNGLHKIAACIADQLCPILFTSPSAWKSSTCNTAAEMILRLEEWSEYSHSQRIADYLKLAQSIETGFLCSVVVYVHKKLMQLIKQIPRLEDFYRQLCQILVQQDLVSVRHVSEKNELIVIDVLKCFLWLNNYPILQEFVDKITMPTKENNVCLQALLASPGVWKASLATEDGKQILQILIDCRLRELSLLQPPVFSWQQTEAEMPNCPEVENFLRSSELTTTFSQKFLNVSQARIWAVAHFGFGCESLSCPDSQFFVNHRYSATVHVKKIAGGLAVCEITKNRRMYEYDVRQFESKQKEIVDLIERRRTEISDEPSARLHKRVKFHFS